MYESHGMYKSSEYVAWRGIKKRCFLETCKAYKDYGSIGITMQNSWRSSFLAFLEHIGKKPDDGLHYSVDRIDNNLGYFEGNVRWATASTQARNRGKLSSNSSGFTGVKFVNKRNLPPNENKFTLYTRAMCRENGKYKSKSFSVSKYGLLPAFAMACASREKMILQLNLNGAGYSAAHGK